MIAEICDQRADGRGDCSCSVCAAKGRANALETVRRVRAGQALGERYTAETIAYVEAVERCFPTMPRA